MLGRLALVLVLTPALLFSATASDSTPTTDPTATVGTVALRALVGANTLDYSRAVQVEATEIPLEAATLTIERGVLVPTAAIGGRSIELAFVGSARFRLRPADAIEADQLELFTDQRAIDLAIDRAVVILAEPGRSEALLASGAPVTLGPEERERTETVHRDWMTRTERRSSGVESALFKALLGDEPFRRYVAAWCQGPDYRDFLFQVDPDDFEPLRIASFSPVPFDRWDRGQAAYTLRTAQRKGRMLGVRMEDLGAWDVWTSAQVAAEGREEPLLPRNVGFEARHYEIDVHISRNGLDMKSTARVRLEAQDGGRRAVSMALHRDLVVDRVVDESGEALFHFRTPTEIVVVLDEAPPPGKVFELEIEYGGRGLRYAGEFAFDLADTAKWHPHCGTIDRATYDVTLRWPRKWDLVASGRLVDKGRSRRYLWERRVIDRPTIAFSFAIGQFVTATRQVDDVEITVAFDRGGRQRLSEPFKARVLDGVEEAFTYFEEHFGHYPLDYLTVVTMPRGYSQSYLGFIAISNDILPTPWGDEFTFERETVLAHEIAHQWWGNEVGWSSYRDQWLSEATANFAALVYQADRLGQGTSLIAEMAAGWRSSLDAPTQRGRTVATLGPVVLGGRLNSTLGGRAYRAIVYRKGAVVLAMMARAIGEDRFRHMLGLLARESRGRLLTTETFLGEIERMSGLDLEGFARRYIYGSGIPRVYYEWESDRDASGRWRVTGQAHVAASARWRHRVHLDDQGRWDVRRRSRERQAHLEEAALVVPYLVEFVDAEGKTVRQQGQITLQGNDDTFEVAVAGEPRSVAFDPRGEILAWFYSTDRQAKRVARLRARDHIAAGRATEAARWFRRALEVDNADADAGEYGARRRDEAHRLEDAKIHLALSALHLDAGDLERGSQELAAAESLLEDDDVSYRFERDALNARLTIQSGDHDAAYRDLRKTLRRAGLWFNRSGPTSWRQRVWKQRFDADWVTANDLFALLAVAAFETGKDLELEWALTQAVGRGVDLGPLQAAIEERLPKTEDETAGL